MGSTADARNRSETFYVPSRARSFEIFRVSAVASRARGVNYVSAARRKTTDPEEKKKTASAYERERNGVNVRRVRPYARMVYTHAHEARNGVFWRSKNKNA